jgi:hypothetical protein
MTAMFSIAANDLYRVHGLTLAERIYDNKTITLLEKILSDLSTIVSTAFIFTQITKKLGIFCQAKMQQKCKRSI